MFFYRHAPRLALLGLLLTAGSAQAADDPDAGRQWQPGDHHVHSEWSVDWDRSTSPPTPVRGGDSHYTRTRNAQAAHAYRLTWMVHTDHGGPGHAAVDRDQAWPALQQARQAVPELVQFHGMEFNVPAGEHASLIIAPGADERGQLYEIERRYSRGDAFPEDPRDDQPQRMLEGLAYMRQLSPTPLMIINHPSRTATGMGRWGDVTPAELQAWHAAAPRVLVGMEGAPGHQASAQHRGLYRNAPAPTLGGFDQMVAVVGGVWDQLLASGTRLWITANSDSHVNARDGGEEFDPGQYSKTYVWARHTPHDLMDGLRQGRVFTVTGDLVDALSLQVGTPDGRAVAQLGGQVALSAGAPMQVRLRVHRPTAVNAHGQRPPLDHVELIVGTPGAEGPRMRSRVFGEQDWRREGDWIVAEWTLPVPAGGAFVRARGSSTPERIPAPDVPGEDPWQDLWFYTNPVFVVPASS